MPARTLFLSAVLLLTTAATLSAGPPWIAIELPANPHHASTRNATMLVRAYHHTTLLAVPVTGVAEGIVDGRRVSLPLEIRATNQTGVFAVTTPLPVGGTWILAITATVSPTATATALVTVDGGGRIVAIDVPADRTRDGWSVPRNVERGDIDAALHAAHVALTAQQPERYGSAPADDDNGLAYTLPLMLFGGAAVAGAVQLRGRRRFRP